MPFWSDRTVFLSIESFADNNSAVSPSTGVPDSLITEIETVDERSCAIEDKQVKRQIIKVATLRMFTYFRQMKYVKAG